MSYDCNRAPILAKCINCSSHCECEAEAQEFTSKDFEIFREGFFSGQANIINKLAKQFITYTDEEDDVYPSIFESDIKDFIYKIMK